MISSLFDKKTTKKIDSLAKKISEIELEKEKLSKQIMTKTSKEMIYNVLDMAEKFGHPKEQQQSKLLRDKYENKEDFSIDDLLTLRALYNSNYEYSNRGDSNE